MSCHSGLDIVNDGLVFAYDMENTQKSWKGKPTENLLTLAGSDAAVERSGTGYPFYQVDITSIVRSRWTAGNNVLNFSIEGKRDFAVGGTAGGNDGYPAAYVFFGDWSWAASGGPATYDWTLYNQTFTMPDPSTKSVYFAVYHMNAGNPGKSYSKNHQVEFGSYKTPFVNGTRSNTQAIVDQTGRSVVTTNSLTYNSDSTFNFAGGNDASTISIPLSTAFNKLTGTISMWVNPDGYSGSNGLFVNRDVSTANAVDWLWMGSWNSGNPFYFRLGDGSTCCNNDLTLSNWATYCPVGSWTYVTCSWTSAGTSKIYTNGVQRASRTISAIPSTNPSTTGRIGLGHESPGSWNGKIGLVQIYDRQLSDAEVLINFNAQRGRYGL